MYALERLRVKYFPRKCEPLHVNKGKLMTIPNIGIYTTFSQAKTRPLPRDGIRELQNPTLIKNPQLWHFYTSTTPFAQPS